MSQKTPELITPTVALVMVCSVAYATWAMLASWLGCGFLEATCWASPPTGPDGQPHPNVSETRSAVVRNIGLAVLGIIGAFLAVWRTMIAHIEAKALSDSAVAAHKQLEISSRQVEVAIRQAEVATQQAEATAQQQRAARTADREARIDRATQFLAGSNLDDRRSGLAILRELFSEDHGCYVQVQSLMCAFLRDFSETYWDDREPRDCPPDFAEAIETVCTLRRSDTAPEIEREANWRPNLVAGWFRSLPSTSRPLILTRGELAGSHFSQANLRRVNMTAADLAQCDFSRAVLTRGRLAESVAASCTFHAATLLGADMTSAVLTDSDFTHAQMGGVTLEKANLTGADLRGASLEDDYFGRILLGGAKLSGARFSPDARPLLEEMGIDCDQVSFEDANGG